MSINNSKPIHDTLLLADLLSKSAERHHSVRALIISSPGRYQRAAKEARRAGFLPELVRGDFSLFASNSSCRTAASTGYNSSDPRAEAHDRMSVYMNMVESVRRAAQIIVARNVSHTVFEDDIVLASSRDAVQSYLATRSGYDLVHLGGCLGLGWNSKRRKTATYFSCAHAVYYSPAAARAYLELSGGLTLDPLQRAPNCSHLPNGIDGTARPALCGTVTSPGPFKCADWKPLLRAYQGTGYIPRAWDVRCTDRQCERARKRLPCRGWYGIGHITQDRLVVKPHLHTYDNGRTTTNALRELLSQEGENATSSDLQTQDLHGDLGPHSGRDGYELGSLHSQPRAD